MILGLDCATKTGWALVTSQNIIESGVQDFSKQRGESNGMMFLRFRKWLVDMLQQYKITLVAYEQAHHRGGAATEIGVNLTGRVQEICAELGIEYTPVHTGILKKWATGRGNADKVSMIAAANSKVPHHGPKSLILDDNEADAILIALWVGLQVRQ